MVELALHLDPGSGTPLYEQLYGALAGQIRTGRLAEGTRLPGKRSLAAVSYTHLTLPTIA